MLGLDYILSPFSSEEFINSYWGRKALYIPGNSDKFENLFNWETVNDLLFSNRNYLGCRLLYEKKGLPSSSFDNLDEWLEKGATLVINHVNKIDPLVDKFQAVLSYELNAHININAYMSYPAKQGFDNHFDFHDVFIVQTEGEKDWFIFEPTRTYPIHKQPNQDKGDPPDSKPYLKCKLSPGDVIYIPRGHWHYAVANTPSIHLTVGPESRTGSELLHWWAFRLMEGDEFFRKDFPIIRSPLMGGSRDISSYREHMDEFRKRLIEFINDEEFMDELLTRYCMLKNPRRTENSLPFAWDEVSGLTEKSELVIRPEQKFVVHYDDETRSALLIIRGKELEIEEIPKIVLAGILSAQGENSVSGKDLLELEMGLEWEQLKKWLESLYRSGLLVRV